MFGSKMDAAWSVPIVVDRRFPGALPELSPGIHSLLFYFSLLASETLLRQP